MNKRAWWLAECKFHNYPFVLQYSRAKKCGCPSCLQSHRDCHKSIKINREHKTGIFCKEWTQCNICSTIKFYTKVLRHFGGVECSKKCPVCQWGFGTRKLYKENIPRITIELYGLMFGERVRARVVLNEWKKTTNGNISNNNKL